MTWLQFIVEIAKALAWPSVVVFVFIYLRKPLSGLVPFLEEFKYGDFVLKFRAGISKVKLESRANAQVNPPTQLLAPIENLRNMLYNVASISPTAAVVQAWAELETKLTERALAVGAATSTDTIRGNSRLGHALLNSEVFNQTDFQSFHNLRNLRNIAAHKADTGLQEKDATDYVDLVIELMARTSGNSDV